MSHFAKVEDSIVVSVIVAEQDYINYLPDKEKWFQTSYNTKGGVHYNPNTNIPSDTQHKSFRKNYAGVGYTYDIDRDAFIPPKPYSSMILNENSCLWEYYVPCPNNEKSYQWDETTLSWIELK